VLLNQYTKDKEIMDETNPLGTQNERQLWHGITLQMTQHGPMPVTAINARGFNRSFAGKSTGGLKFRLVFELLEYIYFGD
jgi:hypothetical protein